MMGILGGRMLRPGQFCFMDEYIYLCVALEKLYLVQMFIWYKCLEVMMQVCKNMQGAAWDCFQWMGSIVYLTALERISMIG